MTMARKRRASKRHHCPLLTRDNAMCESFFATLECELIERLTFRTRDKARVAIIDVIEGRCSRAHLAVGNRLDRDHLQGLPFLCIDHARRET